MLLPPVNESTCLDCLTLDELHSGTIVVSIFIYHPVTMSVLNICVLARLRESHTWDSTNTSSACLSFVVVPLGIGHSGYGGK